MDLKPPRKKKNAPPRAVAGPPLPVFVEMPSGYVADDAMTPTFRGCFNGFSVVVDSAEDMKLLYKMGYFGKGSLSRSFPNFGKRKNGNPTMVFETQWKRRKEWIDKLQEVFGFNEVALNRNDGRQDKGDQREDRPEAEVKGSEEPPVESSNGSYPKDSNATYSNDSEILVVADLNTTALDPRPRVEHELVETVVEVSHLSLEESFFLTYALGCLEVSNLADELLSPVECWASFRKSQNDFTECYVVYHHYRAKGWVVKSGLKYGGQFLLYNDKGPSFYHASYVVVVVNVGKPNSSEPSSRDSWEKYSSLNRIAEQANKELILCQVKWPSPNLIDYDTPEVIRHFRVKDCLFGRWSASANLSLDD